MAMTWIRALAVAGLVVSAYWWFEHPADFEPRTALIGFGISLFGTVVEVGKSRLSVRSILTLARGLTPIGAFLIGVFQLARAFDLVSNKAEGGQVVLFLLFAFSLVTLAALILSRLAQPSQGPKTTATPPLVASQEGVQVLQGGFHGVLVQGMQGGSIFVQSNPPVQRRQGNTLQVDGRPRVIGTSFEIRTFRLRQLGDSEEKARVNGAFPILVAEVWNSGSEPVHVEQVHMEIRRIKKPRRQGDLAFAVDASFNALLDCSVFLDPNLEVQEKVLSVGSDIGPQQSRRLVLVFGQDVGLRKLSPVEYQVTASVQTEAGELALGEHRIAIDFSYEVSLNAQGKVWLLPSEGRARTREAS